MLKKVLTGTEKRLADISQSQNRLLLAEIGHTKMMIGKLLASGIIKSGLVENIHDAEFKVFSQWGDDGILQYLINILSVDNECFVEFGVENYLEANTRFLLLNNNWRGLVLDGSDANIDYIKADEIYWKYDLTAISRFVTAENINELLLSSGFKGEIGLLHIDIDGNDYWIWNAIESTDPVVVSVEYNSLFGCERSITIPYKPDFERLEAHHSGLYAGCSLLALCDLADAKGYAFVGSNSAGNNAYFVRKNRLGVLRQLTPREGYVKSKFREHRDEEGQLTFMSGNDALETVRGLPVYNTRTNTIEAL